jgi:hypothetical protein
VKLRGAGVACTNKELKCLQILHSISIRAYITKNSEGIIYICVEEYNSVIISTLKENLKSP